MHSYKDRPKRKLVRAACMAAAALMALTLTACGSGGSSSGGDSSAEHDLTPRDYSEYMTLGEHSGMDIEVSELQRVDEAAVREQIDALVDSAAEPEQITEGVTAVGDTINMDFIGYRDGEAFEGGTAYGFEYQIGSGQFIEDLDTQLSGLDVGGTYDLVCTFPEDYHSEDLAGVEVTFQVTVNYILGDYITPEWNDEFVAEYTEGAYTTTADYEAYIREHLEDEASTTQRTEYIENLWNAVLENCTFEGLPEEEVAEAQAYYYNNIVDYYNSFAEQYGTDLAGVLEMFGSNEEELDEYARSMAENEVRSFMVANMICLEEDIELDEETYREQMEEDAASYGYASFEEFETEAGRGYLTDSYKYTMALTWLQEHNNMVEVPQTAEVGTEAETAG